jgi:hypothetical protein
MLPQCTGRLRGVRDSLTSALELRRRLPRLRAGLLIKPGRSPYMRYLRAAQAYMLISMPTDTSTIFGVFHVIGISVLWLWRVAFRRGEGKADPNPTQVRCAAVMAIVFSVKPPSRSTMQRRLVVMGRWVPINLRLATISTGAKALVRRGCLVPWHPRFHPCPDWPH